MKGMCVIKLTLKVYNLILNRNIYFICDRTEDSLNAAPAELNKF